MLGGLLFGFDIAIITGAGPFLNDHFQLDDLGLGWAFSSLLFGCIRGDGRRGPVDRPVGAEAGLARRGGAVRGHDGRHGAGAELSDRSSWPVFSAGWRSAGPRSSRRCTSRRLPRAALRGRLCAFYQLSITVGHPRFLLHQLPAPRCRALELAMDVHQRRDSLGRCSCYAPARARDAPLPLQVGTPRRGLRPARAGSPARARRDSRSPRSRKAWLTPGRFLARAGAARNPPGPDGRLRAGDPGALVGHQHVHRLRSRSSSGRPDGRWTPRCSRRSSSA